MADKLSIEGLKSAAETTKQIISLSTLLLGFTLTFAKEFKGKDENLTVPISMQVSWGLLFLAIVAGLLTMMAITGSINAAESHGGKVDAQAKTVTRPAVACVIFFILAILAMVIAGADVVR